MAADTTESLPRKIETRREELDSLTGQLDEEDIDVFFTEL